MFKRIAFTLAIAIVIIFVPYQLGKIIFLFPILDGVNMKLQTWFMGVYDLAVIVGIGGIIWIIVDRSLALWQWIKTGK